MGRGPLIVEDDLVQALTQGTIKGAALDVFDTGKGEEREGGREGGILGAGVPVVVVVDGSIYINGGLESA